MVARRKTRGTVTGKVKKWFDDKGFGFITGDDGQDVFVHHRDIAGAGRKSLTPGQRVEYEIVDNPPKGLAAANVRPI